MFMLSDVVSNMMTYGNYIFFSILVMIIIGVAAMAGVRFLKWRSVSVKLYGVMIGISHSKLVALSMLLIRMLFFWSIIIFSTKLEFTHLCYGIILTLIINILLADPDLFLFDLLNTAAVFGELYGSGLLKSYLAGVRFNIFVFIMVAVITAAVIATTLYSSLVCIKSIVKQKKDKQKFKPEVLWQNGLLIITGVFMTVIPCYYMNRIDTLIIRQEVYQYTAEGRRNYNGVSKITRAGLDSLLENKNRMQELDSTPLYYVNENKILLPSVTSIIRPKLSLTNRIVNMSQLYKKDGQYYVKNEGATVKVSDFFLYDGKDTYLFFEPVTIDWKGQSMKLSPFSYIVVKYNQSISAYNRKTNKYTSIGTGLCNVKAAMSNGVTINLSTDILSVEGGQDKMLFLQPNLLEDLK
jgi:hypothetical protein